MIERIASFRSRVFRTPLHNPFVTARRRTADSSAVAVTLVLESGREFFGEAVPLTYVTGETIAGIRAAVKRASVDLAGADLIDYGPIMRVIGEAAPQEPAARCGLEMAVFNAWSDTRSISLSSLWGGVLKQVETDITIPMVDNSVELAVIAWERGFRILKIKVGRPNHEDDISYVRALHRAVPDAVLRLDANQAFTPDDAIQFIQQLTREGEQIQLFEQPVPADDFEGLARVAAESSVPIFADESLKTPFDALRLASTPVHGFNIKLNKCGIMGALEILAVARAANKRLMLGCMLETRRSIAVALALACGTGAFDYIDLDSHLLLNEPGANPFFMQNGPRMLLPE